MRALIIVALLSVPGAAAAQFEDWTDPFAPVEIAPGLTYVGSAGLGAFLFTSDEGHVLIDAPMAENVDLLLTNIRAAGFDPTDIRIHLASHAHYDHVGGFAGLLVATGGDLWLAEADAPFVTSGVDFGFESEGYPAAVPAQTFTDGYEVVLGDIRLTAHVTAGHTPGCTTWSGTVRIEEEEHAFVIACSVSVLPTYRLVGPDPTYEGHGEDYCRSIERLRSLSPSIFLAGHGSFFDLGRKAAAARIGDPRAFVETDLYGRWLDRAEQALEEALSAQGHTGGCAALTGVR